METWGITHRGTVRQQNQDAFASQRLEDGRIIALVCDGMGGARAGNVASRQGTVDHRGVQDTEAPVRRPSQSCLSERSGAVGMRQGASSEPARDFIFFLPKEKKAVMK